METITVYTFETVEGAENLLALLQELIKHQNLTLEDAAVVTWPREQNKPRTKHLADMAGSDGLGGAFWGMLFGLIFFVPLFGMAFSSSMGALVGHFSKYGVDKRFIRQIQEKVIEGTSAFFLMTGDATTIDKVTNTVKTSGLRFDIVTSTLSSGQDQQLHEDFG